MSVCIHLTQVCLHRVLQLLRQRSLLVHEVVAQLLTQVLQILLFRHQLLLFLLQLSLLTLRTLTAQEGVRLHFALEIQHVLLESLVLFLECFRLRVQLHHRFLVLRLQLVRSLYGQRVMGQNRIRVHNGDRQQLTGSLNLVVSRLLRPRVYGKKENKQGNYSSCQNRLNNNTNLVHTL